MTDQQKIILKKVGFPIYWGYAKIKEAQKKFWKKIRKLQKKMQKKIRIIQKEKQKKIKNDYIQKHPVEVVENTYYERLGRHINWDNPQDLNEKINWLKFHADPYEWARLADKFRVREYVKSRGLGDILVPLYGKWNTVQGVLDAWDSLPDEFVLKSNNGCKNYLIVSNETGGKAAVNNDDLKNPLTLFVTEVEAPLWSVAVRVMI